MIHQLPIYEIFERNKAAVHPRFRESAQQRDLVGTIEDRLLLPTDYSPRELRASA